MPNAFSSTTRSLDAGRARAWTVVLTVGLLLVAVWTWWSVAGRVAVYETSDAARLEVDSAVYPLAAPVSGRVVRTRLAIGRSIAANEVVVELDPGAEELARTALEAEIEDLRGRIVAIRHSLRSEEAVLRSEVDARGVAVRAGVAQSQEAAERARLVEEELARMSQIQRAGGVSEMELMRLRADAKARRSSAEAAEFAAATLDRDRQVAVGSRRARIAELQRDLAELDGQVAVKTAQLDELAYSLRQRVIRAPAAGHIGEVAELEVGSVVRAGERLGSIVPDGEVRVVALFPARALGRIRPGQRARMRLAGFSWTEYGALSARVASVASEPAQGRFRVELKLDAVRHLATPVQHGLPGSVAVEVDRVSPATLVLRAVGRLADLDRDRARDRARDVVSSAAKRGAA